MKRRSLTFIGDARRPMDGTATKPARAARPEKRWLAAVTSLAAGTAFLAFWFWLLPRWLSFRVNFVGEAWWRWLAAVPSAFGFAVALRCVWDFGWMGSGTPVPAAPPKRLVAVGFYLYVRNPMYAGFAAGWIGLWIVLGRTDFIAMAAAAAVACAVHLFVVFYEEPTLRRKFGTEYEAYCRNVRRWWPRLRAWDQRPSDSRK
jgi:protein-S-isoprenylcysteine O-methyltransferase Ste14